MKVKQKQNIDLKAKVFKRVFYFHPFGYSVAAKARKYGLEKNTYIEKIGFSYDVEEICLETTIILQKLVHLTVNMDASWLLQNLIN